MSTSMIIVTILMVLATLFKLYSVKKNGFKNFFKSFVTKKLIVLPIVALIYGVYILSYPDIEIESPKTIITEYISSVMQ